MQGKNLKQIENEIELELAIVVGDFASKFAY